MSSTGQPGFTGGVPGPKVDRCNAHVAVVTGACTEEALPAPAIAKAPVGGGATYDKFARVCSYPHRICTDAI